MTGYDKLSFLEVTHCVSKAELTKKISNLTMAQQISLFIVIGMISLVIFSTITHLIGHDGLKSISLITTAVNLVKVDTDENRVSGLDFVKLVFTAQAVVIHSSVCLVTVTAPYVINRLGDIDKHIGDLWMQPLINTIGVIVAAGIR